MTEICLLCDVEWEIGAEGTWEEKEMVAQGRKEIIAQVCALASAATSLVGT